MARTPVNVALLIPDASPLITLSRIDRLDLLDPFVARLVIVELVADEARRPANDPQGKVAAWMQSKGAGVEIAETLVGLGFRAKLARGEKPASNMGEIAVEEYATMMARTTPQTFIALVLFEDPDVLELRLARMKGVHLINTVAYIRALEAVGLVEDGRAIIDAINARRKTPMQPFDTPGKTKRMISRVASDP